MSARVVEREARAFERDLPPTDVVQKILDALAQDTPVFNRGDSHPAVYLNSLNRQLLAPGVERVDAEFLVDALSVDDARDLGERVVWRGETRFRIDAVISVSVKLSPSFGGAPHRAVSVTVGMISP